MRFRPSLLCAIVASTASLIVFAGCQTALPPAPQTHDISALTQRIQQLESGIQGSNSKIDTVQTSLDANYQKTITTLQQQRQQAADAVYAATQANQQNTQKNAYVEAVAEALQVAAANLGGSDAQGMRDASTQLKLQLAGTKASLAQLQGMHDAQLKAAADIQTQLTQEQANGTAAQQQLAQLQNSRNQLQSNLQTAEDARNQAQTTLAQKLVEENDRFASDAALKKRLMLYLVIAGALAGLAAAAAFRLYPPIGLHLALASGGFFLAAYLVATIEPWVVFLVVGLSCAAIIWAVAIRHRRLSSITNSALGAIQQLKIRAQQGDAIAQQAYATVEADLRSHFGAQIGSLEAEAKQRLAKLPWVPPASVPAPSASTPAAPAVQILTATPSPTTTPAPAVMPAPAAVIAPATPVSTTPSSTTTSTTPPPAATP